MNESTHPRLSALPTNTTSTPPFLHSACTRHAEHVSASTPHHFRTTYDVAQIGECACWQLDARDAGNRPADRIRQGSRGSGWVRFGSGLGQQHVRSGLGWQAGMLEGWQVWDGRFGAGQEQMGTHTTTTAPPAPHAGFTAAAAELQACVCVCVCVWRLLVAVGHAC